MVRKIFELFILIIPIIWVVTSYAKEPEPIGIVTAVKGEVLVTSAGKSETVVEGARVFLGDKFETKENSGVKILFNDDTLISLGSNTQIDITEFVYNPKERKAFYNIFKGKVKAIVQKFKGGESNVEFATPNAVAGIKGTIVWIDLVNNIIAVQQGDLLVRSAEPGKWEVELHDGEFIRILDVKPVPQHLGLDLEEQLQNDTNVKEEVPSRDSYYRDEALREKPISEGSPLDSLIGAPVLPPAPQDPSDNFQNRAPVTIIIPPPPQRR